MEIWKAIEGYEGLYEVSNHGNVKSLERYVKHNYGGLKRISEKKIKPQIQKNGYLCLTLCKKNIKKSVSIHRLVAMAFIPNPDNKPQINHIDGNKQNNNVENLCWCSAIGNMYHAIKHELINNKGEKNPQSKLTNEDVFKIKQLLSDGLTQRAIAKMFGVHYTTINKINTGKSWKHSST